MREGYEKIHGSNLLYVGDIKSDVNFEPNAYDI